LRATAGKAGGKRIKGHGAIEINRPYLKRGSMNSDKAIQLEGTIMMVLPGTMFRVALANERLVLAHISGKMRKRFIRLTIGDRVRMEMSPYDTAKARIVYRL
jgi:translation initiation factor IF-1